MDYAALRVAVEDAVENTFTDSDFATMTKLAEQRIYNSVQFPALRKNQTATLTQGDSYLSAPTDFLSAFSLAVVSNTGEYSYLLDKDVNFIRESFPNPAVQGVPKYYALFGPRSNDFAHRRVGRRSRIQIGGTRIERELERVRG